VLVSVSMNKHSVRTRRDFEDHVMTLPEVTECFSVSGDRDYLLHIVARDMETYNDFLNTQILDHPSVHSASSSFALRRVKYTTALPL
jgi:DNA-binding Lrp family transcriptional regulator